MARARNIKPGFFINEDLVELPFSTRLLFIGLWTIADREGRLDDRPRKIKMAIFPADDVDVERGLAELHGAGMILRYIVDDERFIFIPGFVKHQNPHVNEQASTIPAPDSHGASIVDATPLTSSLNPSSLKDESPTSTSDDVKTVFRAWQKELDHTKAKCDKKRSDIIKARLKDFSVDELCLVPVGVKKSSFHMGDNLQQTKYDGIETIFKSVAQVEKFLALAQNGDGQKSQDGCDVCRNDPNRSMITLKTYGWIFDPVTHELHDCVCKNGSAQR